MLSGKVYHIELVTLNIFTLYIFSIMAFKMHCKKCDNLKSISLLFLGDQNRDNMCTSQILKGLQQKYFCWSADTL